MAKALRQYICQSCGATHTKWAGQCSDCGEWNTLSEEVAPKNVPKGLKAGKGRAVELVALKGERTLPKRFKCSIEEFNRVTGGGLVPGSATLIGGDPGIGKSTLLLQVMAQLSDHMTVAYISGEEGLDQVRLRAERLDVAEKPVHLGSATNMRDILTTLEQPVPETGKRIQAVVIDSIQTVYIDNIDSAPGTVSQVRACSAELIRACKALNICLILVGHVTKEGQIAGPRVLEHMVDTVLYFEGDRGHPFRILRAVKNRFGPTDEIGVFDMRDTGLQEVTNPSALFLSNYNTDVSGSVVFAGIEGSRPVLVEIQALTAPSNYGTPRRAVVGWDTNRLSMIVAVLEARCGISFANKDIYLNVAGGLKITEPAADLAVAAALISAVKDSPLPPETVVFGEIALSGEIRPVSQAPLRLKEASKLGFKHAMTAASGHKNAANAPIKQSQADHLRKLLPLFGA